MAGLFLAMGAFTFICALKDYDWYMMSSKAAIFRLILGRGGARIFYLLMGLLIMGVGVLVGWFSLFGR